MKHHIEPLLIKFLNKSASPKELAILEDWISKPENEPLFEAYIRVHFETNLSMNMPNMKTLKTSLLPTINFRSVRYVLPSKTIRQLAVAAVITAIFVLPLFNFKEDFHNDRSDTPTKQGLFTVDDKAILTLENGQNVSLSKDHQYSNSEVNSNGENLIYTTSAGEQKKSKISYNYLATPRGGQFYVQLADGSKVWLNSETKIKYPIHFSNDKPRLVELLYGEAYFDVAHGNAFKVVHKTQELAVLGTAFNIKANIEDENIETTLLQGRVALKVGADNITLKPKEQYTYNSVSNRGVKKTNINVDHVSSWRNGKVKFQNQSLKEVCTLMERWYDLDIDLQNTKHESIVLSGSLSKNQDINTILLSLKNLKNIEYEINEKHIIIK